MNKRYTVEEVASKLKVSKRTILREIAKGKLTTEKVGRRYLISEKNLKNYLRKDDKNIEKNLKNFLQGKKSEMVDLLQNMVSMASVGYGSGHELALAKFIKRTLDDFGIRNSLHKDGKVVVVRGSFGYADEGIMLDCPIDTTPVGDEKKWKYPPFEGIIKGGRMYGRGTADAKAGIVAMIYTVLALKKYIDEEKVRVELVFDGSEQDGSYLGMQLAIKKGLPVNAGIVGYAGDWDELPIGARGYHRFEFKTQGKAAHTGARFTVGVNAITKMINFISEIEKQKLPTISSKYFEFGQRLTFASIAGGRAINIVPDECKARLDVRTLPDMKKANVVSLIEENIKKLESKDNEFKIKLSYITGREGYLLGSKEKIINVVRKSVTELKKVQPKLAATGPSHIGAMLYEYKVPVVLWGPRGGNAHSYDEYIEIESLPETSQIYAKSILKYFDI